MSEQKKEKPKKFLLPSSLKHMQQHYRNESESFAKNLGKPEDAPTHSKKQQRQHSLFRLNPASEALVSEVPVEVLKKRSKSQKLESLHAEPSKESFFLLDHHRDNQQKRIVEKKFAPKNYNIDLFKKVAEDNKYPVAQEEQPEEEPEKYEIVRPSEPYTVTRVQQQGIFQSTIFQTPILPCFSSEFGKRVGEGTKRVQEGEGVWKIGKIKVKGKKCQLRIGEFIFEGEQVRGEGRAALLSEDALHLLPNWKDMWILQPHQSLFTD